MEVIRDLEKIPHNGKRLVVALGNFDGVHLGHKHIMSEMVKYAEWTKTRSSVLLFHPHPLWVIKPESAPKLLLDLDQKLELISQLGVDLACVVPFQHNLATLTPLQFTKEILVEKLDVAGVFVGFNYRFGHNAAGTPELLGRYGMRFNFLVNVMPPYMLEGSLVSSTEVRMSIEAGDIGKARKLLGYWPLMKGHVVAGDQRGRMLGFPTANIEVPEQLIVPGRGVYAGLAHLGEESYATVLNIGYRPTFYNTMERSIEAHLLNFDGDAYGETIEIELFRKIRDEKKFAVVYDLVQQIKRDIIEASYICGLKGEANQINS